MKKYLLIAIISLLFSACSSVTLMEGQTFRVEKPYLKAVQISIDAAQSQKSDSDYKLRTESRKNPYYAVFPVKFPEGTDPVMVKLLEKEISVLWHLTKGVRKQLAGDAPETLKNECKKNSIDVLIYPAFTEKDGKWQLVQTITDPVNEKIYSSLESVIIPYIPGKEKNGQSFRQIEVYNDGRSYVPVREMSTPGLVWESRPDAAELNELIMKSVTGTLSVGSTSSDTELEIDNEKTGRLPLKDFRIQDGKHIARFTKPGKKPVIKEFVIRGGESRSLYQQWEDDVSGSSIRVTSYPSGTKIAIDGSVRGETPFFENGLSRGKLSVEFLKENQDSMIVLGENAMEIVSGKNYSLAFPLKLENALAVKDFWSPSGGEGFSVDLTDGLSFASPGNMSSGWYGIASDSILPDSVTVSTVLENSKNLKGNFSLNLLEEGGNVFSVEVESDRVSVYSFPSDGVAKASYKFIKDDSETPRTVRFVTNRKNKTLKIYLGRSKVLESPIDFNKLWKVGILTRGENFSNSKVIRSLKIEYPEIIKKIR